jgi:hypothetical protein
MEHFKKVIDETATSCLELPVNSKIPLSNDFLSNIPDYTDNLIKFTYELSRLTDHFLEEKIENKYNFLCGYFLGLCTITSAYLFDSRKDIRTHVRYLSKDNKYEKLVHRHINNY